MTFLHYRQGVSHSLIGAIALFFALYEFMATIVIQTCVVVITTPKEVEQQNHVIIKKSHESSHHVAAVAEKGGVKIKLQTVPNGSRFRILLYTGVGTNEYMVELLHSVQRPSPHDRSYILHISRACSSLISCR